VKPEIQLLINAGVVMMLASLSMDHEDENPRSIALAVLAVAYVVWAFVGE
jgi:hypothetical protein